MLNGNTKIPALSAWIFPLSQENINLKKYIQFHLPTQSTMNITPTKVKYLISVCTSQFNWNTSGQITSLQMPLHRGIALSSPAITQSNTTLKWRHNGRNGVSNH